MSFDPKENIDFDPEWIEQMMKFDKASLVILYAESAKRVLKLEGDLAYHIVTNNDLIQKNSRLRDIIERAKKESPRKWGPCMNVNQYPTNI